MDLVNSRLVAEKAALEQKVYELECEVKELRDLLLPQAEFPREWKLTPTETQLLRVFLPGKVVTRAAIQSLLYRSRVVLNGIDMHFYRMRHKLAVVGITFDNIHGRGWVLSSSIMTNKLRACAVV